MLRVGLKIFFSTRVLRDEIITIKCDLKGASQRLRRTIQVVHFSGDFAASTTTFFAVWFEEVIYTVTGTPERRKGKVDQISKGHIPNIKRALYQQLGAAFYSPQRLGVRIKQHLYCTPKQLLSWKCARSVLVVERPGQGKGWIIYFQRESNSPCGL